MPNTKSKKSKAPASTFGMMLPAATPAQMRRSLTTFTDAEIAAATLALQGAK